jgi:hypothetical protein
MSTPAQALTRRGFLTAAVAASAASHLPLRAASAPASTLRIDYHSLIAKTFFLVASAAAF